MKQRCNKFNKDFEKKKSPHQNNLKKKKKNIVIVNFIGSSLEVKVARQKVLHCFQMVLLSGVSSSSEKRVGYIQNYAINFQIRTAGYVIYYFLNLDISLTDSIIENICFIFPVVVTQVKGLENLYIKTVKNIILGEKTEEKQLGFVTKTVKNLPAMQETQVQFLFWDDPLEEEMAIHSSTLAYRIPWTEEPSRLQSMESQRVGHT